MTRKNDIHMKRFSNDIDAPVPFVIEKNPESRKETNRWEKSTNNTIRRNDHWSIYQFRICPFGLSSEECDFYRHFTSPKLSNRLALRDVASLDVLLQLIQRVELIEAYFAPELVLLISRFFLTASVDVIVPIIFIISLFFHVDTSDVFPQFSFLAECPITHGAVEVSPLLVNSSGVQFQILLRAEFLLTTDTFKVSPFIVNCSNVKF